MTTPACARRPHALRVFPSPEATAALEGALGDPVGDVRWNAAAALAHRGDRAAVPVLEQMLDRDQVGRVEAVTAEQVEGILLQAIAGFTPGGGNITVDIKEQKSQYLNIESEIIEISITDTGIGIAPKHVNHIFDSYYSIEHSGGIKGTGIGLALTKSLVEMHKGKIVVKSIENHQGSSFIIEIQKGNSHFAAEQLLETSDEAESQKLQPGKKVLQQTTNDALTNKEILTP